MRDLIVAGGGPAGLATAIAARRRGLDVLVLDRRRPPLDEACGEGLMPHGVRALHALGVVPAPGSCSPFVGIRYLDGDLVAEGRFASGAGLGVRRTALIEAMSDRARSLGVELRYGCAIENWTDAGETVTVKSSDGAERARFLVGADGLHSRVRRLAGLERRWRGRRRFGIRHHYSGPAWTDYVEVHWADRAEAYVTPVGNEIGVAILCSGDGRDFDELLALFPGLAARLRGRRVTSRTRGAGPFRQGVRRRFRGRIALVGDAAGYLDALTGEGLALAFESAAALARVIARGEALDAYERAYRDLSRGYYRTTALLLAVGARPWLRRRVVASLAARPETFDRLLAVNAGELSLRLGLMGTFRLVAGMLGSTETRSD